MRRAVWWVCPAILVALGGLVPTTAAAAADPKPSPAAKPWQMRHWPQTQPWQLAQAGPRIFAVGAPRPIDLQNFEQPDTMTWDDYRRIPGTNWADPTVRGSVRTFKGALVLVDYPNQPFVVTQPANSTIYGNPTDRARRSAGAGAGVLPRLPQHAGRTQPRAHHPRVLDGGFRWPAWHRAWRVRRLPDAGQEPRVRHRRLPARRGLPERRHLPTQPAHRCPRRLDRRCRRGRGRHSTTSSSTSARVRTSRRPGRSSAR